jgi:hypothetical protein
MDDFLAELYGTQETIGAGEDLEKQAAAEFLVKMAQEEGVDLDQLSDEEVGSLLLEVEKQAADGNLVADDKTEAQEKLAEADFLGRAMAHAYVNELSEIEKQAGGAGALFSHLKGVAKKEGMGSAAKEGVRSQGQALRSMGRALKSVITGKAPTRGAARGKKLGLTITRKPGESTRRTALRALGQSASVASPTLAAGGALAGGAGYGGYKALGGESEKKSYNQAIEEAASERAIQMLAEAGYDVEKVAEADVETRALQILEASGYPVNWS